MVPEELFQHLGYMRQRLIEIDSWQGVP